MYITIIITTTITMTMIITITITITVYMPMSAVRQAGLLRGLGCSGQRVRLVVLIIVKQ